MNTSTLNIEFTPRVTSDPEMDVVIDGKSIGIVKWDAEFQKFVATVSLGAAYPMGYIVVGFGDTREEAVENAASRGLAEAERNLELAREFAGRML